LSIAENDVVQVSQLSPTTPAAWGETGPLSRWAGRRYAPPVCPRGAGHPPISCPPGDRPWCPPARAPCPPGGSSSNRRASITYLRVEVVCRPSVSSVGYRPAAAALARKASEPARHRRTRVKPNQPQLWKQQISRNIDEPPAPLRTGGAPWHAFEEAIVKNERCAPDLDTDWKGNFFTANGSHKGLVPGVSARALQFSKLKFWETGCAKSRFCPRHLGPDKSMLGFPEIGLAVTRRFRTACMVVICRVILEPGFQDHEKSVDAETRTCTVDRSRTAEALATFARLRNTECDTAADLSLLEGAAATFASSRAGNPPGRKGDPWLLPLPVRPARASVLQLLSSAEAVPPLTPRWRTALA